MIETIMQNPRELGYNEKEKMANDIVEMLSRIPDMSYDKAYLAIKSHIAVYEEALSHLNHNAAIEMRDKPVRFVLA